MASNKETKHQMTTKLRKNSTGPTHTYMASNKETKHQMTTKRKNSTGSTDTDNIKSPYFNKKTKLNPTCFRLDSQFYNQSCTKLAKALLGQTLVRILDNGERLSGKIVETEAYLGIEDSAAHTYEGHQSARNQSMYMEPGTAYVYLIYGMYSCFNISSKGEGCAVLIRALEPDQGLETMNHHRSKRRKDTSKPLKPKDLCSGPGKLTEAMLISKDLFDKKDLSTDSLMWLEAGVSVEEIIACPRIGIDNATPEWVAKPLRFYVRGNHHVSKRDKKAESDAHVS